MKEQDLTYNRMNKRNLDKEIKPAIIVHGGAWNIPDLVKDDHLKGVKLGIERGYDILLKNGSSLDAVEAAVISMEDDPVFDAGIGSFLNIDGEVELDALIMDGKSLKAGAIGAVRNCKNPISLARLLLEKTPLMMLVGLGADKFAVEMNLDCNPKELIISRELERWKKEQTDIRWKKGLTDIFTPNTMGTVGAVALDKEGNLASATSTGGSPLKKVGRLGDTPLIGSGGYASKIAAASSTGYGEYFMKIIASKTAVDLVEMGYDPQIAAELVIKKVQTVGGYGGIILIDNKGRIGYSFNTDRMAYAFIEQNGQIVVEIDH